MGAALSGRNLPKILLVLPFFCNEGEVGLRIKRPIVHPFRLVDGVGYLILVVSFSW